MSVGVGITGVKFAVFNEVGVAEDAVFKGMDTTSGAFVAAGTVVGASVGLVSGVGVSTA